MSGVVVKGWDNGAVDAGKNRSNKGRCDVDAVMHPVNPFDTGVPGYLGVWINPEDRNRNLLVRSTGPLKKVDPKNWEDTRGRGVQYPAAVRAIANLMGLEGEYLKQPARGDRGCLTASVKAAEERRQASKAPDKQASKRKASEAEAANHCPHCTALMCHLSPHAC